jgi:hypothetical protein
MVLCYGIKKIKMGEGKANRPGCKHEEGKDQDIFPRNFMLIHHNYILLRIDLSHGYLDFF